MKYIGLSGVAGAGKDLFYSLLSKRIPCQRFSLADGLKSDVRDWCIENYNIDGVNGISIGALTHHIRSVDIGLDF